MACSHVRSWHGVCDLLHLALRQLLLTGFLLEAKGGAAVVGRVAVTEAVVTSTLGRQGGQRCAFMKLNYVKSVTYVTYNGNVKW